MQSTSWAVPCESGAARARHAAAGAGLVRRIAAGPAGRLAHSWRRHGDRRSGPAAGPREHGASGTEPAERCRRFSAKRKPLERIAVASRVMASQLPRDYSLPDNGPDEAGLPLLIQPRMEVIGDPQRLNPRHWPTRPDDRPGQRPGARIRRSVRCRAGGGGRADSQPVRHVPGFVTVSPGSPGGVTGSCWCCSPPRRPSGAVRSCSSGGRRAHTARGGRVRLDRARRGVPGAAGRQAPGRSRGLRQVIVPVAVVTLLDMRRRGA